MQDSVHGNAFFREWEIIWSVMGKELSSIMSEKITDETIEYVSILAKLELSQEEKRQAKADMNKMIGFIEQMNELDTSEVEPMSHSFSLQNVFREDVVTNIDDSKQILHNAPEQKDNMFVVPKTIDS